MSLDVIDAPFASHFLLEASLNLIDASPFAFHFTVQQKTFHRQEVLYEDSQCSILYTWQGTQR